VLNISLFSLLGLMDNIHSVDENFDFQNIILTHPESLHGGSFFTKLQSNNNPFYLQTPKCISKQGVVISNGKKSYIDLMFSNEDNKFIEFMENLEKTCISKIFEKKNLWFTNDIDQSDIENAFTSALRPFKGGKYYLLRVTILPPKNLLKTPSCFIFDESENQLQLEDIKSENEIICILEIQGIKFTSRSFQYEINCKQVLILANKPVFQSCVIKKNNTTHPTISTIQNNLETQIITSELNNNSNKIIEEFHVPEEIHEKDFKNNDINDNNEKDEKDEKNEKYEKDEKDEKDKNHEKDEKDEKNENNLVEKVNESLVISSSLDQINNNNSINSLETLTNSSINDVKTNEDNFPEFEEVHLEIPSNEESIKLKKQNDVYYEIYRIAKEKARNARKLAFDAYLEVKKIKNTYMLEDSDSEFDSESDSDSESNDSNDSSSIHSIE